MYLYGGKQDRALADINPASELDPKDAYYALWVDIVNKRSSLPSKLAQAMTQIDMTKWPAPVIRLYLGQLTSAAVLAGADDSDADVKQRRLCDANFFIGELALQQGSKEEASRLFRLAATGCSKDRTSGTAPTPNLKPSVLPPDRSEVHASRAWLGVHGACVAMNAASASRSAAGMVRPSFVRRHKMSSGNRAHSLAMR